MIHLMLPHVRALTPAQSRVLLAMLPDEPCDAWSISARITTLYELQARGLIEQGSRGWLDARLTELGSTLRWQIRDRSDYREAAE
jgi:hypothetical protein